MCVVGNIVYNVLSAIMVVVAFGSFIYTTIELIKAHRHYNQYMKALKQEEEAQAKASLGEKKQKGWVVNIPDPREYSRIILKSR